MLVCIEVVGVPVVGLCHEVLQLAGELPVAQPGEQLTSGPARLARGGVGIHLRGNPLEQLPGEVDVGGQRSSVARGEAVLVDVRLEPGREVMLVDHWPILPRARQDWRLKVRALLQEDVRCRSRWGKSPPISPW